MWTVHFGQYMRLSCNLRVVSVRSWPSVRNAGCCYIQPSNVIDDYHRFERIACFRYDSVLMGIASTQSEQVCAHSTFNSDIKMVEGQDLDEDDLQVMGAASSATVDIQQEHCADGACVHSEWLRWIMEKLKTTPELKGIQIHGLSCFWLFASRRWWQA